MAQELLNHGTLFNRFLSQVTPVPFNSRKERIHLAALPLLATTTEKVDSYRETAT
jgi:hypothetical protein